MYDFLSSIVLSGLFFTYNTKKKTKWKLGAVQFWKIKASGYFGKVLISGQIYMFKYNTSWLKSLKNLPVSNYWYTKRLSILINACNPFTFIVSENTSKENNFSLKWWLEIMVTLTNLNLNQETGKWASMKLLHIIAYFQYRVYIIRLTVKIFSLFIHLIYKMLSQLHLY